MPEAEGMIIDFDSKDKIDTEVLEKLEYNGLPQLVSYSTDEFSAVCPFSGLPDVATVVVDYIPSNCIVELKSLKYYFISFRNVGIYQEDMTSRIFQDLKALLNPKYLSVFTKYNIRGGIGANCKIETSNKEKALEKHVYEENR